MVSDFSALTAESSADGEYNCIDGTAVTSVAGMLTVAVTDVSASVGTVAGFVDSVIVCVVLLSVAIVVGESWCFVVVAAVTAVSVDVVPIAVLFVVVAAVPVVDGILVEVVSCENSVLLSKMSFLKKIKTLFKKFHIQSTTFITLLYIYIYNCFKSFDWAEQFFANQRIFEAKEEKNRQKAIKTNNCLKKC